MERRGFYQLGRGFKGLVKGLEEPGRGREGLGRGLKKFKKLKLKAIWIADFDSL